MCVALPGSAIFFGVGGRQGINPRVFSAINLNCILTPGPVVVIHQNLVLAVAQVFQAVAHHGVAATFPGIDADIHRAFFFLKFLDDFERSTFHCGRIDFRQKLHREVQRQAAHNRHASLKLWRGSRAKGSRIQRAIKQSKRSYCKARAMAAIPRRIGCVNPCLRRRLGNAAFTRARSANCCITPEPGCIRCSKVALWKITTVVLKTKAVGGCPKARVPHQAARRSHCKHFFNHERRRRFRRWRRFCRLCSFRRRRPGKRLFANYPYKFTIEIHPGLLFNKLAFTVHRRAIINTRLGREVQVHATVWQCFKRQRCSPVPCAARSQIDFANFHAGCVCDSQRRRKFFLLYGHTLRSRLNNGRRRRCNFCSRHGSGLGSRCTRAQNNGTGNQQGLQRVQLSQNLDCHSALLSNTDINYFGTKSGWSLPAKEDSPESIAGVFTLQRRIARQPGRRTRHQT